MPAGTLTRYPSLQQIADLFRSSINDDMTGATNTPGEGQIATNSAPFMPTFISAAVRDTYADLRNVGDPALVLDNFVLYALPCMSQPNPTTQVQLSGTGYFDGFQWNSNFALPAQCVKVLSLWERRSGSGDEFRPMEEVRGGLLPRNQERGMRYWETRQNGVWMPGCLESVDIRIRCSVTFPDFLGPNLDFAACYVPIVDCLNTVVAKMLVLYARRFAPEMYQTAAQEAEGTLAKLRNEVVRQMQRSRTEHGREGLYL